MHLCLQSWPDLPAAKWALNHFVAVPGVIIGRDNFPLQCCSAD